MRPTADRPPSRSARVDWAWAGGSDVNRLTRPRAVVIVMLLAGAVSCRKYENSSDYCERDDQCPSAQCNLAAKKCAPSSMPDGGVASDAGGAPGLGGSAATGGLGGAAGTGVGGLAAGGATGDEAGRGGDDGLGGDGLGPPGGSAGQSAPGRMGGG